GEPQALEQFDQEDRIEKVPCALDHGWDLSLSVKKGGPARLHHRAEKYDPHQRHWNEYFPAEPHDLVVAIAGKRGADPQEDEQHRADLDEQPADPVAERVQPENLGFVQLRPR